jgi:ADP-ribose pyrophosphatase YjhB (NUDIX family)
MCPKTNLIKFIMVQLVLENKGPIAIGILLKTTDGKILLQLRDNDPKIHYPNTWSIFTGGLEESDWDGNLESSLRRGILRELSEELSVMTKKGEIPFVLDSEFVHLDEGVYSDPSQNYSDYQYVFCAKINIPFEKLKLKEGQKLGLFEKQDLPKLNLAPSYKRAIKKFVENKECLLNKIAKPEQTHELEISC